ALLLGLWRREMNAAFAYEKHPRFAVLHTHEADHAAALATQLSAVGHATPPPPEDDADLDVAAAKVAAAKPAGVLAAAVALEQDLEAVYRDALPALPDAKIAMTAATILASHAQHLFILRAAAGVT
ncbi:MAG TPA: ferritin-like domain-containing protein, partial [Solirubrobacter sp.]|nr:ferritin-like domain-containing protein [Solirubrobacter sp.]